MELHSEADRDRWRSWIEAIRRRAPSGRGRCSRGRRLPRSCCPRRRTRPGRTSSDLWADSAPMSASASSRHCSISASLRTWSGCGLVACVAAIAWPGNELDVTDPDGHRTPRHAQFVGDLLERPRLGAERTCPVPFRVLATVAHASIMTIGCGRDDDQVEARIGRVGDSLPPAGSCVTPSTTPVGSTPSSRSSTAAVDRGAEQTC